MLAGAFAARGRAHGAVPRTIGASTLASLACPPLTFLMVQLLTRPSAVFTHRGMRALLVTTITGAFIALPLGVVFGIIYAVPIGVQAWLPARPALGSLDLLLMVLGAGSARRTDLTPRSGALGLR